MEQKDSAKKSKEDIKNMGKEEEEEEDIDRSGRVKGRKKIKVTEISGESSSESDT